MKYFWFLLFTFSFAFAQPLLAQKLIVDSFVEAQGDLTASAQATQRLDTNGDACALIKVYLPNSGAEFRGNLVGSVDFKVNQYWVYLTKGSKTLSIDLPGYFPLDIRFEDYGISGVQAKTTYILQIMTEGNAQVAESPAQNVIKEEEQKEEPVIAQEPEKPAVTETPKPATETPKPKPATSFLNPPTFYIGANYQLGGMQGIGLNAGMNIKKFNAEIDFVKGFSKSDPVYWSGNTVSQESYEYSASYGLGARFGYMLGVNDRFRITPQIGVGYVQVNGEAETSSSKSPALDTYAISATIGAKVDFDIVRNFGISLCPEFAIPVSQGGIYKGLSEADSTIKGFGSGFNVRAGIYVCF